MEGPDTIVWTPSGAEGGHLTRSECPAEPSRGKRADGSITF